MEITIRNFKPAAPRVQVSRMFGFLLATIPNTARLDTRTARKGFMEVMVSMSGNPRRYGPSDNVRYDITGIKAYGHQSDGHQ